VGLVYSQALLDRASAYVAKPVEARRYAEGMAEITALYSAITGQPVGTCQQCQYLDFLAAVNAYIREATRFLHPETMADSKYTIVPGMQNEKFVHENYSKVVTADNMTDADAEFLIKNGFKHAILPKEAPKAEDEGDQKPVLKLKADFQARFKELFEADADEKLTIAQLTEHIEAKEADAAYQVPA
jgi:hypothetical protein